MNKYMNIITSNTVRNLTLALAAVLLVAVSFAIAPKAHADYLEDSYNAYPIDSGYTPDSFNAYPIDSGYTPDSYNAYPIDSGYTPSYSGGYSGGYGGGSFFTGGGYMGSSGYSSSYSSVYAPTNTCTATNSCNTTTQINAPTNIVTNTSGGGSYPVYQPSYPVYQPVYSSVYVPPVYYPAQRPIAYNNTPYVTLSQVPYTGLDLGPVGTTLYWGFLVLWCLIAAYLIAVKKIQNKIAAWFMHSTPEHVAHVARAPHHHVAHAAHATHAHKTHSGIDPFIQSQINRAK